MSEKIMKKRKREREREGEKNFFNYYLIDVRAQSNEKSLKNQDSTIFQLISLKGSLITHFFSLSLSFTLFHSLSYSPLHSVMN
jgi:hypothetical protein